MRCIQDPSQSSVNNLYSVRHEDRRYFRNKKKAYLKLKLRNLKLTLRSKVLGTFVGTSMILRIVTSLELI